MARELKEITIDGDKYAFGCWEPEFALGMLTKLIKTVGEPVARMIIESGKIAKEKEEGMDAEMEDADMANVVGTMISSLGPNLHEAEVKAFFSDAQEQITINGKPAKALYKAHYSGRIGLLLKVTRAQLQHQFQDFLELMPALSL